MKDAKFNKNLLSEQTCMEAVLKLREQGYMVLLLTENELGGVDAKSVENRLTELAWEVIEDLGGTLPQKS